MSSPVTIKSFAILGFGVTGKSILNFLLKSHIAELKKSDYKIVINIYDEKNINKKRESLVSMQNNQNMQRLINQIN